MQPGWPDRAARKLAPLAGARGGERYEQLYAMLLDAIPSSVLLIDRHARVVSANRNFLEKAQRRPADTLGQPVEAVFPPPILEQTELVHRIRCAFERCESTQGQRITYRAPGLATRVYYYSLIPFLWQGVVEHVMLLMEDVSEQVRLGEEVRRAERHLASVVESASDIVLSAGTTGRILTWNAAAEKISGYTLSEAQQRSFFDLCAESHRGGARRGFEWAQAGHGFGLAEWDLVTKAGLLVPVAWVGSVMRDDLGRVAAIVAVGRDLSERRKLEAQLLQAQKLAALGVLAGGIAHEIRNPLSISSSAAQFLRDDPDDVGFRRECVSKILDGIRRASVVIEDLLRFARPGAAVDMQPLDLVGVMGEAIGLATHQAGIQRVKVVLELPEGPVYVSGVPSLLQQVLMNLLLNALTAMPDGGVLRATVQGDGEEAHVKIADSGRGMSAAEIEKIFDPFYTTMPVGKGTGLGLSICYSIVRQHFGVISAESAAGRGSTFTIRLPLIAGEDADADRKRPRADR